MYESTTYLFFRLNHVFSRRFGWRLHPIFRQFVNLINHNKIQWYSRWNTSNHMLSEEISLLITIALYLVMTLALISFFCFFSSLTMRLLVFHLEYHCILLWLIRLTNCLKMGWSLRPKRRENTWSSRKTK